MRTSKSSERGLTPGSASSLSRIPRFLKPDLKDAVDFPDIDTISSLLGIKRREAEKVVIRKRENLAGYKVREVFCTKETRELKKEILTLLSSYAATKNGREMVLSLTPSLDLKELQERFKAVKESENLHALLGDAGISRVRELMSNVEIGKQKFGKSPLIAIRRRGIEEEIREHYDDFVRVEFIDSAAKAEAILQKENTVLLVSEGEGGFDEPGIINITRGSVAEPCEMYPEFVVNSFSAKKNAIDAIVSIVTEFEALADSYFFNGVARADLEAVLTLIAGLEAARGRGESSFDEVIYRREEELNREASRMMQSGGGVDAFTAYLEEVLVNVADELMLTGADKNVLWESAYDNLERGLPFEFSREKTERLRQTYNRAMGAQRYYTLRDAAKHLEQHREAVSSAITMLFRLDFMLAVLHFSRDFGLTIPEISEEGLGVVMGRNIFLVSEELREGEKVVPVSYAIGKTNAGIFGAAPHPVAILTGANSGGKTCLLVMLASSIILSELGLPLPAERAEIPLIPLYLYRRKMIKKTGSFEYSMRALSRIFMREGAKVVLIDELEALTEPGAMGRIMASILNNLPKDTQAVVITHLIHEILPHIRMEKVRVDGIESEGLDTAGTIIVDRQPRFNHIGSSTPELVIKKLLGKVRKEKLKAVYEEIINVLEKERKGAF
jgi:DNA mismatch repair protein MutS2